MLISLVEKKPISDPGFSRILSNYKFFADKIADMELQPKDVYEAIGKLQIVNITLDRNVDDAQAIFESLNSTGKELLESVMDRFFRDYLTMKTTRIPKIDRVYEGFKAYHLNCEFGTIR